MIALSAFVALIIAVLPHPPDPHYDCMLIVRARADVLCAPGGNAIPIEKRKWTGACNASECP